MSAISEFVESLSPDERRARIRVIRKFAMGHIAADEEMDTTPEKPFRATLGGPTTSHLHAGLTIARLSPEERARRVALAQARREHKAAMAAKREARDARRRKILAMKSTGYSRKEILAALGISKHQYEDDLSHLRAAGLLHQIPKMSGRQTSPNVAERRKQIEELRATGLKRREIRARLGIDDVTISNDERRDRANT